MRLDLIGFTVFILCAALGLYLWIAFPGWALYFQVLDLHVMSGIVLTIIAAPLMVRHLRRYRSSGRRFRQAAVGLVLLSVPLFVFRDATLLEGYFLFAASAMCLLTGILVGLSGFAQPRIHQEEARPQGGRHGFSLGIASLAAIAMGWLALYMRSDEAQVPRKWHSAAGLLVVFLLAGHLPLKYLPVKTPKWLLGLLCGAALAFWYGHYQWEHVTEIYRDGVVARWETAESPASLEEIVRGEWTTFDLDAEHGSESCGAAGCHELLHRQWRGSAHRFSVDNDFYRKVVALFVEQKGPEAAGFCASCHDPVRVYNGTVAQAYADGNPPPGEGVSCIGCHVAFDAPEPHRNGVVEFRRPRPYPGTDDVARADNIAVDPRFHMRNFLVENFHIKGPSCIPCHRLQLPGPHDPALILQSVVALDYPGAEYAPTPPPAEESGPGGQLEREFYGYEGCIECHLVVPATFGERVNSEFGYRGGYGIYSHFIIGLNSDLALYVNHPDADVDAMERSAERVEAFLAGDVQGELLHPSLQPKGPGIPEGGPVAPPDGVLTMDLSVDDEGSSLGLRTQTWHYRASHPFPIGPFDLFEVWQEVLVRDAGAQTVFHQGWLDESLRVDPAAHVLGARELNAEGEPIKRHQVWTITAVEDKRVIHSGGSVQDTYEVPLPPDVARPLTVEVTWHFRRANQDFVDWVYDGPGRTMPIRELAAASAQVP